MNRKLPNPLERLRAHLSHRPALRGYLLLSPTLGLVGALMCIPILAMGVMSFWQQTGHMSFDMSGTLQNYVEALTRDMYRVLFLRSLGISGLTTLPGLNQATPYLCCCYCPNLSGQGTDTCRCVPPDRAEDLNPARNKQRGSDP